MNSLKISTLLMVFIVSMSTVSHAMWTRVTTPIRQVSQEEKEEILKKNKQEIENLKRSPAALLNTSYDSIKDKDQAYIFEVLSAQIQELKNQVKALQRSQTVRGAAINLPEKNK